jgi:hypothetical protein
VAQDVELAVAVVQVQLDRPVALVEALPEALPISASSNSIPCGMSIRTRCSNRFLGPSGRSQPEVLLRAFSLT